MAKKHRDREELVRDVEAAFPVAPVPWWPLRYHWDPPASSEERMALAHLLGKAWPDISMESARLLADRSAHWTLSVDAFLYYLPAFLVHFLEEEPEGILVDRVRSILYAVLWTDHPEFGGTVLTEQQRTTLEEFWDYGCAVHPDEFVESFKER
jgi:hypothetical protein